MSENNSYKPAFPAYDIGTFTARVAGKMDRIGLAEIFPPNGEPTPPRHAPEPDGYDYQGRPVHDRPGPQPRATL